MNCLLLVVSAYLLGAIPFGLLIGLAHGVDIRRHGSGNIGATNVGRLVGRRWGYLCLALDLLKGLLPTLAASFVLVEKPLTWPITVQWLLVGVAAVLGHVFPPYLKFRGGKGVATTVGVALGIFPYYTVAIAAALLMYALVRFATGHVSAGSLTLAAAFPIAFFVHLGIDADMEFGTFWPLGIAAILLGILIIIRHRSNIAQLIGNRQAKITGSDTEGCDPQQES